MSMVQTFEAWLLRLRQRRWANLAVVNLRILIAFAFVPAGLKKLLHQRFTDADNAGLFHDFLHGFYATGGFYQFVGAVQLTAAALLMTQRFATVGAFAMLPVVTAIMVFCWSTAAPPTVTVVTLMFLATIALALWDLPKWRGVFYPDHTDAHVHIPALPPVIDARLWQWCGIAILTLYLSASALAGEVYRPRRVELDTPAFYLLPAIAMLPVVTLIVEHRRRRRRR